MPIAAGVRIGRYEILAPIGAGGMGEVYRARDAQLDRSVAIKILTASVHATSQQRERFQREARAIARITHPHICAVYDAGEVDGVPFLVMELLEGETLAERLEGGPLAVNQALAIAGDVASALDAAHRKGVVHRDLKPSNVMLGPGGVKLLDFGLAKLRDLDRDEIVDRSTQSLGLTQDGTLLGTVPYMAPEQVEGRDVDARTDVFALGVMLHEMITGRAPFEGRSRASLMAAILTNEPPPVSSLRAATPATVDRIVTKCLAKDPGERWQSAADLASALRWSRDDGSGIHREHRAIRARLPAGRAAWLALGAVAGAAGMWMLAGSGAFGPARASDPRFIPLTFRNGTVSAARFAPDGETVIYSAAWNGAPYALYMTRRGSQESRPLDFPNAKLLAVSSSGDLMFLRGPHDAVRFLLPARSGTLARVALTGGAPREIQDGVIAADWSPASDEVAVVHRERLEFPIGTTIHGPNLFRQVRIAPDGQRLALVDGASVVVIDRAGRKTTLSSGWGDTISVAWSPSGDEVWFTANHRGNDISLWTLRAVSLDGRERVLVSSAGTMLSILDVFRDGRALITSGVARMGCSCLAPGEAQPRDLSWLDGSAPEALSLDGRSVLLTEVLRGAGDKGAIYLRRTDGSDAIRLGDGFGEDLSPDGNWVLATPTNRQHWIIMPTGSGSARTLPSGSLEARGEANFLPNGRQIVFRGREKGRAGRIYVQDIDGGAMRAISPENVMTDGLATPDSRYVVGRAGRTTSQFAVDGGPAIPMPYVSPDDSALRWSADGSLLYVWRTDAWPARVDRVNVMTGGREPWRTIHFADPAGADTVFRIVITPDGKSYCHDYVRILSELFLVEGLK
jgi:Tol biopolymer transport system component